MTDLRAERRAIAARLFDAEKPLRYGIYHDGIKWAYETADAIIQHDLDNPPEWEAVKESLTTEGWVRAADRMPTEEDAPNGRIHILTLHGVVITASLSGYLASDHDRQYCPLWHPTTECYQIPPAPEVGP